MQTQRPARRANRLKAPAISCTVRTNIAGGKFLGPSGRGGSCPGSPISEEKSRKKIAIRSGCRALRSASHIAFGLSDQRSTSPGSSSGALLVMSRCFAPVLGALLFDVGEILVEHDAAFARQRHEAFAARAADQG